MEPGGAPHFSQPARHPSFASVRRSDLPPAARTQVDVGTTPWTAARGKRLLRPISSRLAQLSKTPAATSAANECFAEIAHEQHGEIHPLPEFARCKGWAPSDSSLDCKDPEWEPQVRPSKRLRKTYSCRASASNTTEITFQKRIPVQVTTVQLQSPLVCKASDYELGNGQADKAGFSKIIWSGTDTNLSTARSGDYPRILKSKPREGFRRLAKSVASEQWTTYDGLYQNVHALLSNTTKPKQQGVNSMSSLFSMCLRKLPRYILKEQELAKEHNPDEPEDVVSFMYDELENFSTAKTPMRDVVRAHGITLVCAAIEEGTIALSLADGLVGLCLEMAAFAEAQSLVISMLKIGGSFPKLTVTPTRLFSHSVSPALRSLWRITQVSGQYGFLFQQLSVLIARGVLPISWLSSQDMADVWNRALQAIVQNQKGAREAIELARAFFGRFCNEECPAQFDARYSNEHGYRQLKTKFGQDPDDKLPAANRDREDLGNGVIETTINILTILLSAIYVHNMPLETPLRSPDSGSSRHLLKCITMDSLRTNQQSLAENNEDLPTTNVSYALLPSLSFLICMDQMSFQSNLASACLERLSSLLSTPDPALLDTFTSLLCSMGQCCSRITNSPPFTVMKHICDGLQDAYLSTHQEFFAQAATSTAFEFAETTLRQEHLDWALQVEEAYSDPYKGLRRSPHRACRGHDSRNVERKSSVTFRWEDSICEWVAVTPAPLKARAKAVRNASKPKTSKNLRERSVGADFDLASNSAGPRSTPRRMSLEVSSTSSSYAVPPQGPHKDLSPLVVIPKEPAARSRNPTATEYDRSGTPLAVSKPLKPRFRFRPRPTRLGETDHVPDEARNLERSDRLNEHCTLKFDSDPDLFRGEAKLQSLSIEVRIPRPSFDDMSISDSEADEEALRPCSLPSVNVNPPSTGIEVQVPRSHLLLASGCVGSREELTDVTDHSTSGSEAKSIKHRQLQSGSRSFTPETVLPEEARLSKRVSRPRARANKPICPGAGIGMWHPRQSNAVTKTASLLSGENSSEDELGF